MSSVELNIPVEDEILEQLEDASAQYGAAVGFVLVSFHESGMAFYASYAPSDTDAQRFVAHVQGGLEGAGQVKH